MIHGLECGLVLRIGFVLVLHGLCSCGPKVEAPIPEGGRILGAGGAAQAGLEGTPVSGPEGNPVESPNKPPVVDAVSGFTPEEDIVFTNPDDPESSLPELSEIIGDPSRRQGGWQKSIVVSKRLAAREGKPLLIWFTDSDRSPMCRAMSEELFAKSAFQTWADENLIRLKIDDNEPISDPNKSLGDVEDMRIRHRNYIIMLKKQYKVLGTPSLVLLTPGGKVQAHYRGYKRGDAEYTWGLIRQGVAVTAKEYGEWRSALEKKGYREWHDRQGRSVFAKLTRYQDGMLTLIEPDGTRSRTSELKLIDADRLWIKQQKMARQGQ